jgi:hypothetical protein
MVLLVYALVYFAMPYLVFKALRPLIDSPLAAWAAAILMIPVGIVMYVRGFEYLRICQEITAPCGHGSETLRADTEP